jgi:transcription-repair coupling factor (superfamily II helicase)
MLCISGYFVLDINQKMNVNDIISKYTESPQLQSINQWLRDTTSGDIHISGLVGSSDAFVASSVFKSTEYNHFFILNNKEEAAYFQNNLKSLLQQKDVFYFPDSFKRPQVFDEILNTNILMRTETVNRLINTNSKAELVVTYPEALIEQVVKADKLNEQTLNLEVGERMDIDFAIDLLVEFDFERVDFVYEPGQFSIRGGIVDIYSFGNEYPYRIELDDENIASIRTFDTNTQLSVKKISRITIVPNIQTFFSNEFKMPLFESLKENTIIWAKDMELVIDVMSATMEKAINFYSNKKVQELEAKHPFQDGSPIEVFVDASATLQQLKKFRIIEFGSRSFLRSAKKITFDTKPQPSFNKNFELLIKDLKANDEKGYSSFLFSDNKKQIERFYAIFEDLKTDVKFTPVYHTVHEGFIDDQLKIACYTDHQIFNRFHKYNLRQGYSRDSQLLLKTLRELKPGDFVTHIDHGVGVFSGLEKIEVGGHLQETVRLIYAGNDILYVGIQSLHKISKYVGKEGNEPRVNKLGTETWSNLKKKTKKRIKELAIDLIKLYAKRKSQKGFAFNPDNYMQAELEASFMYEDTPDQAKATEDVKRDMQKMTPMDRLVCGDVGFGKTEVAVRAAFKAVLDGKQVAVLVPTTILAMQHYRTFKERLAEFPVTIDYINRFKSAKEKKDTLQKLEEGKIDILIGTHGIVGKSVKFKDLGLMVIDEEQKFGVQVKETLKEMRATIDSLTLTATPIPRTLQFSMMGARDLSIINTAPPNRLPVTTEVHTLNPDVIKEAIEFEVYRGGQVFFVHNKVKDILDVKRMLQKIVPNVEMEVAHGQLEGEQLEDVLMRFVNKEFDVLLSTNIIEAGIDISNANTIIINNAHQFGMSDLHQLRGRVGRSNKQAFCYLLSPPTSTLTQEARQRLKTLEEFAELGSGFNIAMRDMDIRGAGNLLGAEQSGFISEIGYDVYHKILDEAVRELKQTDFKDLYKEELDRTNDYVKDCAIESDLEMMIPDSYVKNSAERMILYRQINEIKTEQELYEFETQLTDRFGKVPKQIFELFNGMRLKWIATKLGMEQMIIKNKHLRCYFISNQESSFYSSEIFARIMKYVQQHQRGVYLRETEKYLVLNIEGVSSMSKAKESLNEINEFVFGAS